MKTKHIIEILFETLPPAFTTAEAADLLRSNGYKAPEKALEIWANKGQLIRLKRGLYTNASSYNPLVIAGAIHSPSYISFETALAIYGLIPERVEAVMSVVDGPQLKFRVYDRLFLYRKQKRRLFAEGMTMTAIADKFVLIATKEKALLDTLAWRKFRTAEMSKRDIFDFVKDSLRVEEEDLLKLSRRKMERLATLYHNRAPTLLAEALKEES